ncbi:hypothetical protein [Carboxylicivirga linearis]|uniref:Amidohydrolase-related domain-containing protein n=1 Tax=Carboxylicivirga linearis TaxID=1628157 RepID=A0ABS5K161_9BACT|nr:hypothetical protein [Carboxylicivirga linearis]MBS2100790.1 hypothetical protein [Carboxylicivirga linearis]
MRKLTSHYCLKPDGSWAKRPIIKLNDAGVIIEVREMGDDFVEEPNLEYFPGVLVPTFLMRIHTDDFDKANINRAIIEGARRFIIDKEMSFPNRVRSIVKSGFNTGSADSPWTLIKSEVIEGLDLASAIMNQTQKIAQQFSLDDEWGVIKEGANPGLLLLKGIDLKEFTITSNTDLKVLVE